MRVCWYFVVFLGMGLASVPAWAQTTVSWASAASGSWHDAARWDPAVIPNNDGFNSYQANITATGTAYNVTINNDVTLDGLLVQSSNARVIHTAGTVTAPLLNVHTGRYSLEGGTITNSSILSNVLGSGNGRFEVTGGSSTTSYFNNVSINRTVFLGSGISGDTRPGHLQITGGVELLATQGGFWFQGGGGSVVLPGNQTINGVRSGNQMSEIVFSQQNNYVGEITAENGTLTIGPDVRIRVGSGWTFNYIGRNDEGLLLQGEVSSTVSTRAITIRGDNWRNEGLLYQSGGGQVTLDGTFTTANLGNWSSDNGGDINGRIAIVGTLDNTGDVLDLTKDPETGLGGAMRVAIGGRINGGTIISPNSVSPLRINPGNVGPAWLDGITLDGYMNVSIGEVKILNNLTLANNARVTIDSALGADIANMTFAGNQSIFGSGELVFDRDGDRVNAEVGGSLTIGNGVTVRSGNRGGLLGIAGADLHNQGTISSATSSWPMTVAADIFTNSGLVRVSQNSTLNMTADSITNSGQFNVETGTLNNSSIINNSGVILGRGTINGDILNSGTIQPGSLTGPGILTAGDVDQTTTGTLAILLAGTTPGTGSSKLIADTVVLNGTVSVSLVDGYVPTGGESFDILDWNSVIIWEDYDFDFSNADLGPNYYWNVSAFQTSGVIQVTPVPEPSTILLGLAVCTGLGYRVRRRFCS